MKCLITGGAGFIGSHTADALISLGHDVYIIDDLSSGMKINLNKKAVFVKADIAALNEDRVFKGEGIGMIFHEAARISVEDSLENPQWILGENLRMTNEVIRFAKAEKVRRIIFASSAAVYGDTRRHACRENRPLRPQSAYGWSKLLGEDLLCGMDAVSLRYFNVYGFRSRSGVIFRTISALNNGKQPVLYGDGSARRDFVNVKDVVRANILAMDAPAGIYNVGTGASTGIKRLVKRIYSMGGKTAQPIRLPARAEPHESCASTKLAEEILRFRASIPLKQGLGELVQDSLR